MKNIIRVHSYDVYGLNKYRNFLTPGVIESDDIFETATDMLEEHNCGNSAIFIHTLYDGMYVVFGFENDIEDSDDYYFHIEICSYMHDDVDYFAMFDANNRLCCYSLIIETSDGKWHIVGKE